MTTTCRIKDILQCAYQEALLLGHHHVDTKHILLALLREGDPIQILSDLGIDLNWARQEIRKLTPEHTDLEPTMGDLSVTTRAHHILDSATKEAHLQGCDEPDTLHLLMALLKDPNSPSAKILNPMGITYDTFKHTIA